MIVLREYTQDELEKIKDILISEEIDDLNMNGIIYIILEDDNIMGVSKVEIEGDASLKYILIRKDNRQKNLGEALLRAILSKLDKQGIENVYYKEPNSYLIKKGFTLNNENQLELNLAEFFNKPCCSGKCHEL